MESSSYVVGEATWFGHPMKNLLACLEVFRQLDPEMQAQTMVTFILVAEAHPEPILMTELGKRSGLAQSSVSRNVASLGAWSRHRRPGLKLVEAHEDLMDRRQKLVSLTVSGRRLKGTLENLL